MTGTAPTRTTICATRLLRTAAEMIASPTASPVTTPVVSVFATEATDGLLDDQVTAANRGMRVPFASLAWTYTVSDCPIASDVDAMTVNAMESAETGPLPSPLPHADATSAQASSTLGT